MPPLPSQRHRTAAALLAAASAQSSGRLPKHSATTTTHAIAVEADDSALLSLWTKPISSFHNLHSLVPKVTFLLAFSGLLVVYPVHSIVYDFKKPACFFVSVPIPTPKSRNLTSVLTLFIFCLTNFAFTIITFRKCVGYILTAKLALTIVQNGSNTILDFIGLNITKNNDCFTNLIYQLI